MRVRPTADRTKETLFNMLESRYSLVGTKVLDLYCGSGAFGIECISRGAAEAVFVDISITPVSKNAEALGISDRCRFIKADSLRFVESCSEIFSFIFADPPYSFTGYDMLAEACSGIAHVTVFEHSAGYIPGGKVSDYVIAERKSGRAHLTFFEFSTINTR